MGRSGDRIGGSVTLNGVDISAAVERVICRFGTDMRVAEAEIHFALTPTFADWGPLLIKAGVTNPAFATSGPSTVRFNGLAIDNGVDHWPYTPNLAGAAFLTLADRQRVPTDALGEYLDPFTNPTPLATPSRYDAPGIDMTNNGLGATDQTQILAVLAACGLTSRIQSYPADIGGLPYLLGTQVKAYEQFVWRRAQSGLEYIESLDAMYGFRTFDTPQGYIKRQLVSNLVPPFPTVVATLNENTDVIEGARITRDITNIRNRVQVTGWDDGSGTNVWAVFGAASPLPPGISLLSYEPSSALIEKTRIADPGDGMSCEETATFWLAQLQYPMLEAVVPTWRDDSFTIGSTIYLNCPHLLGVNQAMTLMHLEVEVTGNTFTQILTLRAQDYSVFRGPPVYPLTLPAAMRAGP